MSTGMTVFRLSFQNLNILVFWTRVALTLKLLNLCRWKDIVETALYK